MRTHAWQTSLRRRLQDYTRCPDCAAPLIGATCGRCGLRLGGDDGIRLAAAADAVAAALGRHDDLVVAVRERQGLFRPGENGAGWRVAEVLPDPALWRGTADRWAPRPDPGGRFGGGSWPGGGAAEATAVRPPAPGDATTPASAHRSAAAPGPAGIPHAAAAPGYPGAAPYPVPAPRHPAAAPYPGAAPYARTAPHHPTAAPSRPGSPVDLGAVFALAGSGLFAAAALVFAFFVVDHNPLVRAAALALSTGISAVGTVLLGRRGLRSSAQAVAWLTAALAVVDSWVLALLVQGTARPLVAAVTFAAVIVGGVALARRTGLRAWSALVVLSPLVPLLLGVATDDIAGIAVGVAVAAVVSLVRRPFRELIGPQVGVRIPVESWLLVCWAVASLVVLPTLVTGAIARFDPGSSVGTPALLWIGLGVGLALTAVLAALQGWSEAAPGWLGIAGFLLVSAAAVVGAAVPTRIVTPVGAALVWAVLLIGGGRWRHGRLQRAALIGGGVGVLLSAVAVLESVRVVLEVVRRSVGAGQPDLIPLDVYGPMDIGSWRALVAAGCLLGLAVLVGRVAPADVEVRVPTAPGQFRVDRRPAWERTVARVLAPVATVIVAGTLPTLVSRWAVALLVAEAVLAVALVEVVRRIPRDRFWFPVLLTGAFGQVVLLAPLSWVARPSLVIGGVLVPVLLLRSRRVTAADLRWLPTTVAVGYGATVLGVALSWLGWSASTVLGLVALLLLALGIALTGTRLDTGSWASVWAVAAAPVALVLAWGVGERAWAAGWTAAALAAAEGVLAVTRRRPVPNDLRVLAAAALLPTAALGLINAGAMVLPGSAAPVLLPVIAVLAVTVALSASGADHRLAARGIAGVRRAAEWSAAATGGIGLAVALFWPTTGADTVLVVCALLAAGASVVATRADRRPVWWIAATLWVGVLWTALVWGGVGVVEAYTVPPALVAVGVGGWLTRRRPTRWWPLVASGLALLVAPTLVLLVAGQSIDMRAVALLVVATVLVGAAWPATHSVLRVPMGWAAGVAALAGPIRALWLAAVTPVGTDARNAVVFGGVLVWAVFGGLLIAGAGLLVVRRARAWALVPALAAVTVAGLAAVRPTWTVVWLALAIEAALLVMTALSVRSVVRGRNTVLPPAWCCWLIALAWAIGGWSLRDLRVEVFALPLGIGLTVAGLLATLQTRRTDPTRPGTPGTRSWPVGYSGSMATLAPGVAATLGPSLLAIWTDPATWRAILVVALCLVFMVFGARELMRAPLIIGSVTLGLAVLSVFGTRLGSDISAGPWLLTLLSAGGLLLVLGIYAERRKSGDGEVGRSLR
ncbi:SCO7613 C-terminal domain-containing membrane protein [Cellulomonas taurus]|uniref:SCO7613 C-terminal domain-containing membrane protein n=1 Tax=Cellulomonas taurus TaxID=2729175 RepID=UPI00145D72E8|nr:hypothetical protein [Cellulomonas taurus]